MKNIYLVAMVLAVVSLGACQTVGMHSDKEPVTHADSNKRFDFLMRFNDLNETAFAYHRHCLRNTGSINEKFMSTFDFVADELLDEGIKTTPHMAPEHVVQKILDRRSSIQYQLDRTNMKEGCNTQATEMAKAHYEEFSRYTRSEIRKFIKEKTRE